MQGDKDRGSHRIKRNVDKQRGKKSGRERANKQPLLFVKRYEKVAFADKLINPDDERSFTWKITVNKTMQFATVFLLLCK